MKNILCLSISYFTAGGIDTVKIFQLCFVKLLEIYFRIFLKHVSLVHYTH